jgi:hypothetical protein
MSSCREGSFARLAIANDQRGDLAHGFSVEQEEPMSSTKLQIALFSLLIVPATPGAAQTTIPAGIECGGQYECVEERLLTLTEARASWGYPRSTEEAARTASASVRFVLPVAGEEAVTGASSAQ